MWLPTRRNVAASSDRPRRSRARVDAPAATLPAPHTDPSKVSRVANRTGVPSGSPWTSNRVLSNSSDALGSVYLRNPASGLGNWLTSNGGSKASAPDRAVGVVGAGQVRSDEQATDHGHGQQHRDRRDPGAPAAAVLEGGPAAAGAQRRPADGDEREHGTLEGDRRRGQRAERDAQAEQDQRDEQRRIRTGASGGRRCRSPPPRPARTGTAAPSTGRARRSAATRSAASSSRGPRCDASSTMTSGVGITPPISPSRTAIGPPSRR